MSTLIVDELYPGVTFTQPFKITKDISISNIRPWVMLWGTLADGDFQLVIKDGATTLITKTLNYVTINAAKTQNYAHGFIAFDFDALSLRIPEGSTEKEYILEFSMVGYTKDTSNFLGIIRRWEDPVYTRYGDVSGGVAINDYIEACGLEIFEYKEI